MRRSAALAATLIALARIAAAREATVTAVSPTTCYVDAGTAEGLAVGRAWRAPVGGGERELRVVAVASHSALVEITGGPPPPIGTAIALPADLAAPTAVTLRPPPAAAPAWRDDPSVLHTVQQAAQHDEALPPPSDSVMPDRVRGEVALTALVAADAGDTSTSWQDLALSSQLEVIHGPWQYDHVLEAHLAGAPELWIAPLQHAAARFDIYLLRLAYAPAGARYAASLGRQPGAPLGELGAVDGGRAVFVVGGGADVTLFGGLRPDDQLGVSSWPRAGVDIGYSSRRRLGVTTRADIGVAVDAHGSALDRLQTAGSLAIAHDHSFVQGDTVVDLAPDATDRGGAHLTHASALARTRRGRLTASAQGGYDRPYLDRALSDALGDIASLRLGPRTFAEADLRYALSGGLDVGVLARGAAGEGTRSGYGEVSAAWVRLPWQLGAAPHVVIGTLTDEVGVRGSIGAPLGGWQLGAGGSLDRIRTGGATAWAGLGSLSAGRTFRTRWRTSLSFEAAVGDGPSRLLAFALLGYRIGD